MDLKFLLNSASKMVVFASLKVGLTGLEPVTLRLSSACSNQLSYRPRLRIDRALKRDEQIFSEWRHGDSNPRPIACKATALPTELCPQDSNKAYFHLVENNAKTELCATVSNHLSLNYLSILKGFRHIESTNRFSLAVDLRQNL